jgi:hypothetical protein
MKHEFVRKSAFSVLAAFGQYPAFVCPQVLHKRLMDFFLW